MKSKTVLVPNAQAGELVANGEVEMGVAQASEIAAVPGTQVVGPLPGYLNSVMVFSVGIGSTSKDRAAAKSLIELLTSPTGPTCSSPRAWIRPRPVFTSMGHREGETLHVARESETTVSAAATDHLYLVALAALAN